MSSRRARREEGTGAHAFPPRSAPTIALGSFLVLSVGVLIAVIASGDLVPLWMIGAWMLAALAIALVIGALVPGSSPAPASSDSPVRAATDDPAPASPVDPVPAASDTPATAPAAAPHRADDATRAPE